MIKFITFADTQQKPNCDMKFVPLIGAFRYPVFQPRLKKEFPRQSNGTNTCSYYKHYYL